ncbi:MAG: peptidylprolyl isomerase [Amaricoccus sp.]
MRSLLTAGLLAGIALSSAAFADDKAYDATTVVATVNGTQITLGNLIAMRDRLPQQYQQLPDDVLMKGLIDQMVDQELLAEQLSASPDKDPLTVKLTLDNERRSALAGIAANDAVAGAVDDAKVKAAYDKLVADFKPATEWNASHILVDSEDKAKALKAEIDGGKDFAVVAQANSSDGSAASGGSLGWFGAGQMVPEFEATVVTMKPGDVAGPVKTQFGWHIIKLNETRQTTPPTLDQAKAQIEQQLQQDALQAKLTELRAAAKIDRPDTGIAPAAIRESDLLTN